MNQTDDLERIRALADSLGCILDEDLQLLGGLKNTTTDAWRKRGQGPDYILLGNRYLYPRAAVAAFLQTKIRERTPAPMKGGEL